MVGNIHAIAIEVVVPMHAPQVAGVGALRICIADEGRVNRGRIRQLSKGWQHDALFTESGDTVCEGLRIDDAVGQTELVF